MNMVDDTPRNTRDLDAPALDFERPVVELERRIADLRDAAHGDVSNGALKAEIAGLQGQVEILQQEIFSELTSWQKVLLSRHPRRPYTMDYVNHLCSDFIELHGDRRFADDPSIVCGFAKLRGESVLMVGHQKGRSTKENMIRNFGMPRPEGYRKAMRLMELAARFNRPIICFIDTPGAYPGIGAEERGQAEAIAKNLEVMAGLPVPIISVVLGEGEAAVLWPWVSPTAY